MQQGSGRVPTKSSSLGFLREAGLPVETIVDVGVQRRTPDLMSAFPDKRHILIEPVAENYPHIHRNYAGMDYTLLEAAASDRDGEGILRLRSNAPQTGIFTSSLRDDSKPDAPGAALEERKVREVTLDAALPALNPARPYLLKLDVDGDEPRILAGARETLKQVSCLVIEASIRQLAARVAALEPHGFILWDVIDLNYYMGNLSHFDLVFIPRWHRKIPALSPWSSFPRNPRAMHSYLHEPG